MMISSSARTIAAALLTAGMISLSSAAQADSGTIRFSVYKAAFFIGGSGGEGTLTFKGKTYPVAIAGVSGGLAFGASRTNFRGKVRNISRAQDVSGVYAAVGGGGAAIEGAQVIVMRNEKGATLELTGKQVGLQVNADISGLAITVK
jgi:hypothetical protein